jgi:hypothetical protein
MDCWAKTEAAVKGIVKMRANITNKTDLPCICFSLLQRGYLSGSFMAA